ncbi:hypothetical protein M409DRAFT_17158 [Zasmidium cellare ATCC 36951]|uniref:Mediator of RNA polymerase II transcription subunit 16 n=1 Tax=Zasmidium cellare ATCC 36951 TaxID=1080233 RepID=A0A6A6D299_ZASCE|nr:uncharacterized protein M409DRAFT_17158 [Zasmidium cellare ATCC 36951]KAF2173213.1 hypothetical protein M409DRAFT_17158 [Zasmidium cellare ATCC 36951]
MDAGTVEDQAIPDAAMMDPTMEDLFGEAADGLNVPLPPAPLPAALILRIAEMQSRGCCTKLAWSNTGSIARVSTDGSQIAFRTMIRDKKTAMWTISGESKHPIRAPEGRRFVHIAFSGIGIELAAADNVGTVHIYSLQGPLSRMVPPYNAAGAQSNSSKTESDSVVGLHWLPLFSAEFRGPFVDVAVKNGDRWETQLRQRDQHNLKAHHPAEGRHALLHINRSGEVTLLYQNEGPLWQSTSVSLEPIRSSNEVISHADIGEDGADLLAVTYDQSSNFRLYRISISWNASSQARGNANITLVAPTLEVQHLTCLHNVQSQHADSAKLTHLRLIPTGTEATQTVPTPPTVVAVFTHASLPNDAANNAASFSAIARWRIETTTPALHDAFTKLSHRPGNSTAVLNSVTVLRRQPDVVTNKVLLSFQPQALDTIFAFGASDGSVEFRDRISLEVLQSFGDPSTVSSLPQTGFDHLTGEHNVHVATSADGACIAVVRPDGKLAGHPMIFTHGWSTLEDANKPFVEAGAVCIARQYAFLCYNNMTNDETLALLPPDITPELRATVIRSLFRIIKSSPDVSMLEPQRQQLMVLRDPMIPRSVSAQLALGTNAVTGERDARAQFAFLLLNVRLTATSFAQALSVKDHRVLPPEAINSLRGLVRWLTDLTIYIIKTLSAIKRNLQEGTTPKQALEQLAAKTGNALVYILMCSFTRVLLRFSIQLMGKYFGLVQQIALPRARTVQERQELQSSLDHQNSIPFKLSDFEKVMTEFDQQIREIYTKGGVTPERRAEIEVSIMVDDKIPDELEPAINALVNTIVPKLIETSDVGALYFWNTEWLGISSVKSASNLDVVRKLPIQPETPLRWCRRCGSVSEDYVGDERLRSLPAWMHHATRHCMCLNYWLTA